MEWLSEVEDRQPPNFSSLSLFMMSVCPACLGGGMLGCAAIAVGAVEVVTFSGSSSYRPSLPPYSGFITMHPRADLSTFSVERE